MARRISSEEKYKLIDGVNHKRCSTCAEYLTVDNFSSRSASPDGLSYSCKTCERATANNSYKNKKQKAKAQKRYQDNKEVYIERAKNRYQENKDEILNDQAIWRQTKAGRKSVNDASKRRRQRMLDQTPGGCDYKRSEIVERDSVDGVCICQICKLPIEDLTYDLQIDHIIPIAAGGADIKTNVQCAHKACNITRPKDGRDLLEA